MGSGSPRSSLLRLMVLVPLTSMILLPAASVASRGPSVTTYFSIAVDRRNNFKCREPQRRAYRLDDLIRPVSQKFGEFGNQPSHIIGKRCDGHSGCCEHPMVCSPVDTYEEIINVKVHYLDNTKVRNQSIKVIQHEKCNCSDTQIAVDLCQPGEEQLDNRTTIWNVCFPYQL